MAMKGQLLKFGLLPVVLAVGVAVAISRGLPAAHSAPRGGSMLQGARLYQLACMSCHGPDGNGRGLAPVPGMAAPALDRLDPHVWTEARLAAVIRSGSPPMPAFGAVLPKDAIHNLAVYVRSLQTAPKPAR
jgi:mono/diheme cytochrome c family protein